MEELFYLFQKLVQDLLSSKEKTIIHMRGGKYSGEWEFNTRETLDFMSSNQRYSLAYVFELYGKKLPIDPMFITQPPSNK